MLGQTISMEWRLGASTRRNNLKITEDFDTMMDVNDLMNERARLWEILLTTEFEHQHHDYATTKKSWKQAVKDLKKFDDKITKLLGI